MTGSKHPGRLFVISGPSGVGKSTVTKRVLQASGIQYSVSVTTRQPRPGEVDGRDYRFVDVLTFRAMIERDELLEWADVFGNYYGTPAEPVDRALHAGRPVILEIDVQGGLQVTAKRPDAVGILIVAPDDTTLRQRLAGRGTEDEQVLARRLAKASSEIMTARNSGRYRYEVVNDNLDRAVEEVLGIIRKESPEV